MQFLKNPKNILGAIALIGAPFFSAPLNADPLPVWDSTWTQFAVDDGIVGPGGGGQAFDAEYFFYSLNGTQLSIGLQTGFDVVSGQQAYSGRDYFAGDLAISFDGAPGYEFGVDFGLLTKDYFLQIVDTGSNTGIDDGGIYKNVAWNSNVVPAHAGSAPFALDGGDRIVGANFSQQSGSGTAGGNTSYFRIVSFDLASLGIDYSNPIEMDAHWTMSCGNDTINGGATLTVREPGPSIPEPASVVLLATGLLGLFARRRLQ